MSETVIPVEFGRSYLTDLRNELKDLIYTYAGRTSLAEAIGLLEIVKHELIEEHQ
jgi:hypothetical protein